MKKPTIDEATARKLAVKADCDPRTLRKVLHGGPARSLSAKRAWAILTAEGLLRDRRIA